MGIAERAFVAERVVIDPTQYLDGSAMQRVDGAIRDLKLIYPETGFDALSSCIRCGSFSSADSIVATRLWTV